MSLLKGFEQDEVTAISSNVEVKNCIGLMTNFVMKMS